VCVEPDGRCSLRSQFVSFACSLAKALRRNRPLAHMEPLKTIVLFAGILAAAQIACTAQKIPPRSVVVLRVVDSSTAPPWNPMDDSTTVYRLDVHAPSMSRQVDSVISPLPIPVGDTAVIGLRLSVRTTPDTDATRRLFSLNVATGRVDSWALPPDVWYVAYDVLPSPNGKYYAYVGEDSIPRRGTMAIVRELRTGRVVVRGPAGGGCECDVDMNHVRWFAPDSFEIAVVHSELPNDGWLLIRGRASSGRFRVDTIATEPRWH